VPWEKITLRFDWLHKNNKSNAKITLFDWLSYRDQKEAKLSNCACPRDHFPAPVSIPVAKQTSGNPPLA